MYLTFAICARKKGGGCIYRLDGRPKYPIDGSLRGGTEYWLPIHMDDEPEPARSLGFERIPVELGALYVRPNLGVIDSEQQEPAVGD